MVVLLHHQVLREKGIFYFIHCNVIEIYNNFFSVVILHQLHQLQVVYLLQVQILIDIHNLDLVLILHHQDLDLIHNNHSSHRSSHKHKHNHHQRLHHNHHNHLVQYLLHSLVKALLLVIILQDHQHNKITIDQIRYVFKKHLFHNFPKLTLKFSINSLVNLEDILILKNNLNHILLVMVHNVHKCMVSIKYI